MISTAPNWCRPQSGCQEDASRFGAVETNYSTSDDDRSTGVLINRCCNCWAHSSHKIFRRWKWQGGVLGANRVIWALTVTICIAIGLFCIRLAAVTPGEVKNISGTAEDDCWHGMLRVKKNRHWYYEAWFVFMIQHYGGILERKGGGRSHGRGDKIRLWYYEEWIILLIQNYGGIFEWKTQSHGLGVDRGRKKAIKPPCK